MWSLKFLKCVPNQNRIELTMGFHCYFYLLIVHHVESIPVWIRPKSVYDDDDDDYNHNTSLWFNLDSTRINEDVDKCSNADNLLKPIKRKPISSVQMIRHQFCTMWLVLLSLFGWLLVFTLSRTHQNIYSNGFPCISSHLVSIVTLLISVLIN